MTIYEIDKQIEEMIANAVDPETGELILDNEALDALQMEREMKVENLALYIKNSTALAAGIRAEEKALADRRQAIERKAERLKKLLEYALCGEGYTSSRVSCTFRKSEAVEIAPEFIGWAVDHDSALLRVKAPEADKTAIKAALKNGAVLPFVELVAKKNLTIK